MRTADDSRDRLQKLKTLHISFPFPGFLLCYRVNACPFLNSCQSVCLSVYLYCYLFPRPSVRLLISLFFTILIMAVI